MGFGKQNEDILSILDSEDKNLEEKIIFTTKEDEPGDSVNKFKEGLIFGIKYIATTTVIFALLLWVVNFNAYYQIADSYINKDKYAQISNSLKTSVIQSESYQVEFSNESSDVKLGVTEEEKEKIIDEVRETTFHSMRKLDVEASDREAPLDIEVMPYENRIVIPNLWKNIPMVEVEKREVKNAKELEDIFMDELADGVVRYPGSSVPWKSWNTFVFGHSSNFPWAKWEYNEVFAKLDDLEYWNKIYVYYNQKKYTYKVKKKEVINPRDVKVLKRNTGSDELTLMTCFPVGTTLNRLLVIAELIEE